MGIEIQRVKTDDAEELLSIYAPYVRDTAITFEYNVPSLEEFRERIKNISAILPYIKAVENGRIIGYAYAAKFRTRKAYEWSVETTVYVRREERRKGTGKTLYTALEQSLREMGVLNMNACIASPTKADLKLDESSRLFHEHMGFSPVGTFHGSGYKFDTWYDMIWMEKIIGEHKANQENVRFGEWMLTNAAVE